MVSRKRNTLRTKLFRDMRRAAMQFLSIIALCALGTFAFAALDGTARMMQSTLDTYFEEQQLADFWISTPAADRTALDKVRAVPGMKTVRARSSAELETTLPGDVSVSVTAYDGEMDVNIPLLREGSLLDPSDTRGCLIEERFAAAHGLTLGDRLTVTHVHDNNGLDDEHLFPYMGITDWDRFCRALGETGYDGPLSFETFNALNTFDTALAPQLMSLLGATADLLAGRIEGARKGDMA